MTRWSALSGLTLCAILCAKGQGPKAKSQGPKAKGQRPRAKSQGRIQNQKDADWTCHATVETCSPVPAGSQGGVGGGSSQKKLNQPREGSWKLGGRRRSLRGPVRACEVLLGPWVSAGHSGAQRGTVGQSQVGQGSARRPDQSDI